MKRIVLCLIVCAILLPGNLNSVAQTSDPTAVLVKVNGEEILQRDLDFVMTSFVLPQVQAQNPGKELSAQQQNQIVQNVMNQLVTQKLILQAASKANISVDEERVNQQFETIKAQRPNVPPEGLKQFVQNELTIQKMIELEVASKVTVSDEEARQVYEEQKEQFNEPEQVRASHILIKVSPDATQEEKDAARKKIEEAFAQAKAGKDFAELAKEYSDCPLKEKGGDLGFFARGVMVKPFEDAAFVLGEGEISDIVETPFGYHILKLTGKKAQRTISFEDAKDNVKQKLLQQKKKAEINQWINDLRANANIEIMAPNPPAN